MLIDAWVVVLAAVLLAPQFSAGYPLGRDLVFTPRQPLTADSLGLGSAAPRAVPLDALVAVASRLADGQIIGRIALVVPLLAAGWGSRRLARGAGPLAQAVAAGLAVWNPYVVERLALGQWALLWAYGALTWVVALAARRTLGLRGMAALTGWLAVCSITPTGGVIGGAVALIVGAGRTLRRTGALLAVALALQLPWLVPAMLTAADATSDPAGVAAFAARAERVGGPLGSLLGLGGIWDAGAAPPSRAGVLGYATSLLVLAALFLGWPVVGRWCGGRLRARLLCLAGAGLLVAIASSVPGLAAVVRWAVSEVPGAGLLRDAQKWLMPAVPVAVLATSAAAQRLVDRLAERRTDRVWHFPGLIAALALPALLLPDAVGTLRPVLTPAHYPPDWHAVAARIGSGGDVLVLPFASYRRFDWAAAPSVIDPAPRWVAAPTVVDDRLAVSGRVLTGENGRAAEFGALLQANPQAPPELAAQLARRGVAWVLFEVGTPDPAPVNLSGLDEVYAGPALRLYRVPGPITLRPTATGRRDTVIGADLGVALLVLLAFGVSAFGRARTLLHSPVTSNPEDAQWRS